MSLSRLRSLLDRSAVRQTLALLALFSLISLVAWGVTFLLVQHEMLTSVDARLSERMEAAMDALDAGQELPPGQNGETAEFATDAAREGFETRDAEGTETEMRYLTRSTSYGRIRLGENTELQEELLDRLAGGMILSLLATLVVTSLAGLWMARRSQERLNALNLGLARVARGDLSERIHLNGRDDLGILADRINATTARLEDAVAHIQVQSSNIAHDLRTPLARLRAHLEDCQTEAQQHGRAIPPATIDAALEQIDRINATFEALLRLARLESGAGREDLTKIPLGSLVDEINEIFSPVVEDQGQVLKIEVIDPIDVLGDRNLLVQLLANLIQNAIRYGADRQIITLQAHGRSLRLTDQGPGISFEDRQNVLQPLYQGASTRQGEGFGLGLAMVRAIADLHGAELTLSDGPDARGLCVTIQFPDNTEL